MEYQRSGSAVWNGPSNTGSGKVTTGSKAMEVEMTFNRRFGDDPGTNPEELIAAAHAACFSMALTARLTRANTPPERINTSGTITFRKDETGWTIAKMHLVCEAKVPGLDAAAFAEHAEGAKKGCPVSRLLSPGLEALTLDAKLV